MVRASYPNEWGSDRKTGKNMRYPATQWPSARGNSKVGPPVPLLLFSTHGVRQFSLANPTLGQLQDDASCVLNYLLSTYVPPVHILLLE
jgi:hypothetical protein